MADLVITAANFITSASAVKVSGTAGATITAGQPVYLDSGDSKYKLADADASLATATVKGLAMHGASNGQPLDVVVQDLTGTTMGVTAASGDVILLSPNPGGLTVTSGDLTAGDYRVVVGVFTSTTVAKINPIVGGVI